MTIARRSCEHARSTDRLPLRFKAYDGSARRPDGRRRSRFDLRNERGLSYLVTAPGDLGMARAYVAGDLDVEGVHPGDPYDALRLLQKRLQVPPPVAAEALAIVRGLGLAPTSAAAAAAAGDAAPLAARRRGPAALDDPRRRGDPPPLRRLQPLLRDGARPVDDLHLRGLPRPTTRRWRRRRPTSTTWSARKLDLKPGHAAARRRLRLGRHGPARGQALRRQGARRHAVRASRRRGRRRRSSDEGLGRPRRGRATATTATSPRPASTRSARSG